MDHYTAAKESISKAEKLRASRVALEGLADEDRARLSGVCDELEKAHIQDATGHLAAVFAPAA